MLVARYTLPAHRAAFLLGAGEEADDVVQEAFVKAFRHLSRFRAGEPFGPWLLRIVANETKNLTRSRRRLGMKFGWYRLASGFLTITGHRLGASAPPLSGQAFPGGYALTGFNASGVIFPTQGCWQVTGHVGRVTLTFVTFVIKKTR